VNITPPSIPSSIGLDAGREERCACAEDAAAHKATAVKKRILFII
jgi:hypothetical protein